MDTSTTESVRVAAKLSNLEQENRWLKGLFTATALLSLAAVVLATGTHVRSAVAQEGRSGLQTVQAYEYVLRDSAGRMRARLFFSDANGSPSLAFFDSVGRSRLSMWADDLTTSVVAYSPDGGRFETTMTATLSSAIVRAGRSERGTPKGNAALFAFEHATQLEAEDARGFRTIVGNAAIQDGATAKPRYTTAASVVMYDSNGRAIWQAVPH